MDLTTVVLAQQPQSVVVQTGATTATVITAAVQGPPGPPGQTISTMIVVAAQTISGYSAVSAVSGQAIPADSSDVSHQGNLLGIAIGGALATAPVTVQFFGSLTYNGWAWTLNHPIFLGTNGALTQTPPTSGYSQIIGRPITSTSMLVDIQPAVIL
jgi:hypothetical protein